MSIQAQLEQTLSEALAPDYLSVENESHQHTSGKGSESHFKITLVSAAFAGQGLVQRHRAVQTLIQPFTAAVHAIGLHTYTPEEWQQRGGHAPASPRCAGGGR
jgi:BolA protein